MSRATASGGGFAAWLLCVTLVFLGAPGKARGSEVAGTVRTGERVAAPVRAVPIAGVGSLLRLQREIGDESFGIALKLNRVDFRNAATMDTLLVPGTSRLLDLAPFPSQLAGAGAHAKLLLVSLRLQAFAAYESGRIVMWGPICSGGPRSPTRAGLYHANWKDRDHVSSVDSTWIMPWTVNIDDRVGTALHAYSLPGRPASHCCIRLLDVDARWIFGWIDVNGRTGPGTPVVLFGSYRFDLPPPWRTLPTDTASALGPKELEEALRLLSSGSPSRAGR